MQISHYDVIRALSYRQINSGFFNRPIMTLLKSWYTGGGQEQGFQRRFADGLNQTSSSVCGADTYSQVSQFTVWLQIKVAHCLNIDEGPLYL